MQVTYDSAFVIERFFNISTLPLQKLSNSFLMRRTGFFFVKCLYKFYRGKVLFYKFLLIQSTVQFLCTRFFTYFILI